MCRAMRLSYVNLRPPRAPRIELIANGSIELKHNRVVVYDERLRAISSTLHGAYYISQGFFSRKLLDSKIITLEGSIYDVTGKMLWKRKVKSGNFTARRRPSRASRGAAGVVASKSTSNRTRGYGADGGKKGWAEKEEEEMSNRGAKNGKRRQQADGGERRKKRTTTSSRSSKSSREPRNSTWNGKKEL